MAWAALVFAAPLLLIFPGYAIVSAAFGRREPRGPLRVLLTIAISLAVLALAALPLNYLGGVHPLSWALLELLVVLAACRVAALRRGPDRARRRRPLPRPGRLEAAMLAMAVAAVAAAVTLSTIPLPSDSALGFTQLWILPKPGSARAEAVVGVRSEEQHATDFDLRIRIGADTVVKRSFHLAPGEERQVPLRAPPGEAGEVPVVATLLRHNHPFSVYRRVKSSLTAPEQP